MQFKETTDDIPPNFYYTIRFALLFNYCVGFLKALYFEGRVVSVSPGNVIKWLKENPLEKMIKGAPYIWDFLGRVCPSPVIRAQFALLGQLKEDRWYPYAALAAAAGKLFSPNLWEGPPPSHYLDILLDSGLLVEGRSPSDERLVSPGFWSPSNGPSPPVSWPGNEDGFWVQPNFEVLAPPRLAPALRWQLEMVATPVKMDHACTYALTKEAALGFFDRGGDTEQMLSFLQKYSKNPLPQNVLFTVKEWGANYGRISFLDVFLLRCDDTQLADEIERHPKLGRLVRGRFDHKHLVVARNQYDALLTALQKQGYFPRKGIIRPGT